MQVLKAHLTLACREDARISEMCVAFISDDQVLVCVSIAELVMVYEVELCSAGWAEWELSGHEGRVSSLAISANNKYLVSSDSERLIVWEIASRQLLHSFVQEHTMAVNGLAWSPDGKYFVLSSEDRTARVWTVNEEVRERECVCGKLCVREKERERERERVGVCICV